MNIKFGEMSLMKVGIGEINFDLTAWYHRHTCIIPCIVIYVTRSLLDFSFGKVL